MLFCTFALNKRFLTCLLFVFQIGFSAADAVTGLKLVEAGVPKEQLALLAVPMVPLQILLPVIISKYTAGPRPLDVFYKAFPFRLEHIYAGTQTHAYTHSINQKPTLLLFCACRLLIGLLYALLVWWTPSVKEEGGFPVYYYAIVLLSYAFHQVCIYVTFFNMLFFSTLLPFAQPLS